MDNNWEGDVVVRMVIGADGLLASVKRKDRLRTRGARLAGARMFKRAKLQVPIPSALLGKEFILELRAIYSP